MIERKNIPLIIFGILFVSLQLLQLPIVQYEYTLQQTVEYSLAVYVIGLLLGCSVMAVVPVLKAYLTINPELGTLPQKPGMPGKIVHYSLVCTVLVIAVWGAIVSYTSLPFLAHSGFTQLVYLYGMMIGMALILVSFGYNEIYQYVHRM
jgi:hypothetical protein